MIQYPTRPLESWQKAKELRRKLFWNIWKAQEEGKILVQGVNIYATSLLAGIGDAAMVGIGPNFGSIIRDINLVRECHDVAAQKGYKQSTCASMRLTMGAMFKDIFYRSPSGEQFYPDMCLDIMVCPHQVKGNQVFKDFYHIPHLIIECPPHFEGDRGNHDDFLVAQLHDAVKWLEKTFKKEYDDEKLIEAAYTEWDVAVLFAKVAEAIKVIPTPIDTMRLMAFVNPLMRSGRHVKAIKELFEFLLAEIEDRVRDGIAIEANERFRLIHEGNVPWFYNNMPRLTRQYGALMIGGRTLYGLFGAFTVTEDGSTWEVSKSLRERGIELRNRDDALRSLAELLLHNSPIISGYQFPSMANEAVKVAQDWHADGVIMHIDRGCRAMTAGVMEVKDMLEEKGFPVLAYEGNTADPRDFHQQAVENRIETYLESLGLSKLPAFR